MSTNFANIFGETYFDKRLKKCCYKKIMKNTVGHP